MLSLDTGALVWLVVAIVAAIVEISIPHFGLIFVSVAAIVAGAASALGFGIVMQLVLFSVALAGSLALLRPVFIKKLHGRGVPSRTEALVGRHGMVTEAIDPVSGSGRINVGGQDWAARSGSSVAAGTLVTIVGSDGIVLEVKPT